MKRVFIEELYDLFNRQTKDYYLELKNVEDHELIAFSVGILYILHVLKIDPKDIPSYDHTILDEINYIIKEKFKSSKLPISDEEKLNDFIHDKDDVGFREYIPSREG
jgi:hypothetical protein